MNNNQYRCFVATLALLLVANSAVLLVECGVVLRKQNVSTAISLCTSDFTQGSCICKLVDGSGQIDLTPLVQQTAATPFEYDKGDYQYLLVLCQKITTPGHTNCGNRAAACEYRSYPYSEDFCLGLPETTRFEARKDPETQQFAGALVMDVPNESRRALVFLQCDTAATVEFRSLGNKDSAVDEDGKTLYFLYLKGKGVCPIGGAGGLSGGSILLIVFFSVIGAYVIFGFIACTFIFKKEGRERIPNYSFWAEVPRYAKDGTLFTWNAVKRCSCRGGSNYERS